MSLTELGGGGGAANTKREVQAQLFNMLQT